MARSQPMLKLLATFAAGAAAACNGGRFFKALAANSAATKAENGEGQHSLHSTAGADVAFEPSNSPHGSMLHGHNEHPTDRTTALKPDVASNAQDGVLSPPDRMKIFRVDARSGQLTHDTMDSVVQAALGSDIVLVGESHDDALAHAFELDLLMRLVTQCGPRKVALSLEVCCMAFSPFFPRECLCVCVCVRVCPPL